MEKRQVLFITAIQKRNTKKVSDRRKAFEAGRLHERKILIEILQRERQKNQNKQQEITMAAKRKKKAKSDVKEHRTVCIRGGKEVPCPKKNKQST